MSTILTPFPQEVPETRRSAPVNEEDVAGVVDHGAGWRGGLVQDRLDKLHRAQLSCLAEDLAHLLAAAGRGYRLAEKSCRAVIALTRQCATIDLRLLVRGDTGC